MMLRPLGILGLICIFLCILGPVATAQQATSPLTVTEALDDLLDGETINIPRNSVDIPSKPIAVILESMGSVRDDLSGPSEQSPTNEADDQMVAVALLVANRLVARHIHNADRLRANYEENLDRLEEEDRARLEEEEKDRRRMSAVTRILVSDEWICPVDGTVKFYDSWLEVRSSGKLHKGVDLIGFRGARLLAPVSGNVYFYWDTVGGRSFSLEADNGDYYFGTHLLRFGSPGRVESGDPIGQLGAGGNATGNHLHFEYHPGGRGTQVNPYPIVDVHCTDRLPIEVPLDRAHVR